MDNVFKRVTASCALILLLVFIGILLQLVSASHPAAQANGWHFLVSANWDPVTQQFGALGPLIGTVLTALIALLIAIPFSIGIAIFLTVVAPLALRQPLRIAIELLAGIPGIIYGMWGLLVFAPWFATHGEGWLIAHVGTLPVLGNFFSGEPMGIGVLTAGIILSIMIIPFIAAVVRDVFEIVPDLLKESGFALGATSWEVVRHIMLPHAWRGAIGGIMLGLGRALGETMAVAFVIGNSHDLSASLLMPGSSIASVLANEFTEAVGPLYSASLTELGLILFGITFAIILLSKWLLRSVSACHT